MSSRLALTWLVPSIAAISLAHIGRAGAQAADAEAMFNEGDKLLTAGKVAEACAAFEASNNIDPRAGTLIRLGECREQNHQLASAWTAYKDALGRVKDPHKRDIAAAKVAELEPKLSHLTIVVGANQVAGLAIARNGTTLPAAMWDRALPVDGGDYTILATAPGFGDWRTTITVPPERGDSRATVPALAAVAKPAAPTISTAQVGEQATSSASMWTPKRKLAIAAAATGVVSLGVGIALGVTANGKHDDAFKLCPDPSTPCADASRADALTASGHRFAIGADIAFGVAGAGAIAAGVLWFIGKPESPDRIAVAPTANGISVNGRF